MPVSVRIDATAGIVWFQEVGPACYDDWDAALVRVSVDRAFRRGLHYMIDGRGLTVAPAREDVERGVQLIRIAAAALGAARWALVANANQPATFGTMRLAESLAAAIGVKVRAFLDLDEALGWLTHAEMESTISVMTD